MRYLVFDVMTTKGYLFETPSKRLAHAFCVISDMVRYLGFDVAVYDYDNAMDFS